MRYRVGIDVGTNSVGFAAIEVSKSGMPVRFLNLGVYRHDSGIDPNQNKEAITRLATAGVSRRTRRLRVRRRQRLEKLDKLITSLGWPIVEGADNPDPRHPWFVRSHLAQKYVADDAQRYEMLSIAMRHIARHRGWRSPWIAERSLFIEQPASEQLVALRERCQEEIGEAIPEEATPAQIISFVLTLDPVRRLRGDAGILGGKLMQSDNAYEIRRIAEMQRVPEETLRKLILSVFRSESPKGSAGERVGKDALPGQGHLPRAEKASLAFQRFRIVSVVANLRAIDTETGEICGLSVEQKNKAIDFLMSYSKKDAPSWIDVATAIGIDGESLMGVSQATMESEVASAVPPVNATNIEMSNCKVTTIKKWWKKAIPEEQAALVDLLSFSSKDHEEDEAHYSASQLLTCLSDEDNAKLESIKLPIGRAAYSIDSLERLTERMLDTGEDLFAARQSVFGVERDWTPPAEPIGTPVGNPAVDRVLKQVNRWLLAAESLWGEPESINIEHVRTGFKSKRLADEITRKNSRNFRSNQEMAETIRKIRGIDGTVHASDIRRYKSVQRQNCQCAYCGSQISFTTCEMDHIVPRKGVGSTNTTENLVAVCERCNRAKSNTVFSVWASNCGIDGVSVEDAVERVKFWTKDSNLSPSDFRKLKQAVIFRLRRKTKDAEIDSRSIESVAWMARELAHRVRHHFPSSKVRVYSGSITAAARKAAGFENKVNFIGGKGKTRLDRRHHAMDAATIAMMQHSVAQTLVERGNIRASEQATGAKETWKTYFGNPKRPEAMRVFTIWMERMEKVIDMFNAALKNDAIPVWTNLRLRLSNSKIHLDTLDELAKHKVGDEWTMVDIDKASTPALWCALTRQPDFVWKKGLPADPQRSIVVNGTHYGANDYVDIFKGNSVSASLKVRGGSVSLGAPSAIHHGRIYRVPGKKEPSYYMLRVFSADLSRFRNQNLFNVELPPQSMSVRVATQKLRDAFKDGTAEYVGWFVTGDELELDISSQTDGIIGAFNLEYPETKRWVIDGLPDSRRLRLRPLVMAFEGIDVNASASTKKILDRPGWLCSIGTLFRDCSPTVIHRDALGRMRNYSNKGLPTCWSEGSNNE